MTDKKKVTPKEIADLAELIAILEALSSDEMRENFKDPAYGQAAENCWAAMDDSEIAEQVNAINHPNAKKAEPKPTAPKFVKPQRSKELQILEDMSSDEFRRACARRGPAIESILSRRKA